MGLSRNCCALAPRKNICARCSKPPFEHRCEDDPAIPVETLTKDAPYYAYQAAVCPDAARVASHQVIEEHIGTSGKDYRFEEKPHPVEALRDRTQDNTTIARGKI